MQRAEDAAVAKRQLVGLTKEQVFTCMGLPQRKGVVGDTEVWSYNSGNGRTDKTRSSTSLNDASLGSLSAAIGLGSEVSEKRYCVVQIVMKAERVQAVHYSGPTGGFLTDDEQCAFAVRNCLADAR